MSSLILHHGRSLKLLHKCPNLRVSPQNPFSFSSSFSSTRAKDGQKGQIFTISYLIDSLGLTANLAESISRKVSFEERRNPDSVLNLFRSYGFTDPQIASIITDYPRLLIVDAKKSLGHKLQVLQSRGVSSSELTETVSKVPKILAMKGDKTISRYYDFVREIIEAGKSSKFEKLCQSMPQGMQENKIRNLSVLRELGVPQRLLFPLLVSDRKLVCGKEKFEESLKKVVEMGFEPTTSKFVNALRVVQRISEKEIEEKVSFYKRLGFDVGDVSEMFKKYPVSMRLSEKKITQKFETLKKCGLLEDEILSVFPQCIGASEQKIAKSIETFKDLGFSKNEFAFMVKHFPMCLNISAETVKKKTKFLVKKKNKFMVKKMKWPLNSVAFYPQVLGLSMEKRIVPRCNVMKALMSKGLLGNRESKLPLKEAVLLCTDEEFLRMYVRNHDDKELVAELMAIFNGDRVL
ncbi:unnamed protein product [Arabidopsis lyrata]|uniref:transcription termination factor MTERF15, mitochondrial n=1 Tax=Arabidopsis lyrata subsp. lyrata TaxID=81972 RepID=UPI000A29B509|nr:transcription termination factor MTERF15, mitochondrial [Arabidopsis lyrata subsp. lyrata]CAH8256156.1 unnamed protein product [Arabidopsis lyrata]|eukprot:XP_020889965.1 transcription termination factor MTERF15, mitochondrial [Arabidopsis lyrata subsp. lyrata]